MSEAHANGGGAAGGVEMRAPANSASSPPTDFLASSASRDATWSALPAEVKEHIWHRAAEARTRQAEVETLCAVMDEAWAARFKDAHEFKTALLRKAHDAALRRLKGEWAGRPFSLGQLAQDVPAKPSVEGAQLDASCLEPVNATLDNILDHHGAPTRGTRG